MFNSYEKQIETLIAYGRREFRIVYSI